MFGWLQKRSKPITVDELANRIDGFGSHTVNGEHVNHTSALMVTTVLACVDAIASGCAVPDLHVMRRLDGDQKERATDQRVYRVLHRRPNEFQTAMEFRETMTSHAALTGNAYAYPVIFKGEIIELWPVMPSMVTLRYNERYELIYRVSDEFGFIGDFRHDEILHLKNRSWDRIRGLDAVSQARKAIGLSMATEQNIAALQSNGGKPGGILSTDQNLNADALERIKRAWQDRTTGHAAYNTPVLDAGLSYTPMAMTAVDQQVLETRRMQVEEICRAFGVFPQIVMHADKTATFASAESFFAAHNRLTIGKWQKNWVEKLDEFVLDGDGPLFAEFDNRLMNGATLKDTGEFYAKALGSGGAPPWMTQNEVRAVQGLPPLEGGDELFKPTNAVLDGDNDAKKTDDEDDSEDSR